MDIDGTNRVRIGNFRLPSGIQYLDGWLYFVYDNGQNIVRLNTATNQYTRLINQAQMGQVFSIQVIDGSIYFRSAEMTGLIRIPLAGGTPEVVISTDITVFTVDSEGIFVTTGHASGSNLYRYSRDGQRLNRVATNVGNRRVTVMDGWVYVIAPHVTQSGREHDHIMRVRPDGTGQETIFRQFEMPWVGNWSVGTAISGVNVTDGWVYFWNIFDRHMFPDGRERFRSGLFRMRTDGTGLQEIIRCTQLRNSYSTFRCEFAVIGNYVYVIANNHDFRVGNSELYRVPVTGGRIELLQTHRD